MEALEARVVLATWSGPITSNTLWSNTEVQKIVGSVDVAQGVTLTITAGTVVQFNNGTSLTIDGTLLAQGTSGAMIDFTSVNDNSASGGGNTAAPGNWGNIQFNSDSTGNMLDDTVIQYGGSGGAGMVVDQGGPLTLAGSMITRSSTAGVRVVSASPTLTGDTFQNNQGAAISMNGSSSPAITTATIAGNAVNGVAIDNFATISGQVSWDSPGVAYVVSGLDTVATGATLTIAAGQVVKASPAAIVVVDGTVQASGTAAQPVIFTSLKDDSAGGDTNNDGSNTAPAPGDWNGIQFVKGSSGNTLDHVEVAYGGNNLPGEVDVQGGAGVSLTNSVLGQSATAGLRVEGSSPTVTADTFQKNAGAAVSMDGGSSPTISSPTLSQNKINGVAVDNFATIATSQSWDSPDIVYVVSGLDTVAAGATLTIAAGQVVKATTAAFVVVDGTLLASGTAALPVIFTSAKDDSAGGDTNNDGSSTAPAPGDWNGIQFVKGSSGNVLDHVEVAYGGNNLPGEVDVQGGAGLSLTNSVLSHSATAGLRVEGSSPTLTGDTFENNVGAAITMDAASSPTISGSTLTQNAVNALVLDGSVTIAASTSWDAPGIVYVIKDSVTVAAGATLTIAAGQVVKAGDAGTILTVLGSLQASGTAAQPVIFTSIKDDTAGGDTNNDGNTSAPGAGDWNGLVFAAGSTGNVLDHVVIRYGGNNAPAAVQVQNAPLTLTSSVLSNGNTGGLRIQGSSPNVTGDTFQDNFGDAISMDLASSPVISGSTLTNNGVNGVMLDSGTLPGSATWNNPTIVYVVSSLAVPAGATLTIDAGQIVKFAKGLNDMDVDGTLVAQGAAFQPVVFTSLRDDSAGGDTNNDGTTTTAAPGDWNGLFLKSDSTGNRLDHVEVRFGGGDRFAAVGEVQVINTGLTLTSSTLTESALGGLGLVGSSPTVTGDMFLNNVGPAIAMDVASNPATSGDTATGNAPNGIVVSRGTLAGNVSWTAQDLPYSLSGTVTVPQGTTLTIGPGAVFDGQDNTTFSGNGTIASAGTFLMSSSGAGSMEVDPDFIDTGTLHVESGTLNLFGNLTVNGTGALEGDAGATLALAGNLGGNTTSAGGFSPGSVAFEGGGRSGSPQTVEAMSSDQGSTAAGFSQNFAYNSLTVENFDTLQLVDSAHNSSGSGAEAVYTGNLVVPLEATLDLNGLHLYTRLAQIDGTVINGTVTTVASGGTLALNVTSPSTLAAGGADTWTFFGRAGQTVTIVANTGASSAIVPLPPTLNYAQLTLLDPGGKTVATVSNAQTGADAVLSNEALTADGTYNVRVQAPPAQASSTGNYDLTVWDATPRVAPLALGQTTTGTIDTPYRVDQWTFTAGAGQDVQLDLVGATTPAIQFALTGPSGYTAFSGLSASSGMISLPTTGAYVLTVNTTGTTGSYAFALMTTTITKLTLGTPLSGPIAGSGQSQLFALDVATSGQVQISLADSATADHNELYASLGTIPTRGQAQYQFATAAAANQSLSIPTAAPGTYYILLYTAYAPAASQFTLTATEASVLLTAVTPNRSGTSAATTITLTGLGFDKTSAVSLVSTGGAAYAAGTVSVDSPTQITATFAAGSVPAGVYAARVTESGGASASLPGAITIDQGGQADFHASVIVPDSMGYHIPAVIYIEYSNTGDEAMPAPLVFFTITQKHSDGTTTADAFLTLDPSLVTQGFWTSALPQGFSHSIQILASGATPGVLQPGESERVAVYYAGWQQPWDGTDAPFSFQLSDIQADNSTTVDWNAFKQSLGTPPVDPNAWNAIFANLVAQTGSTWGDFVQTLDQNASYLGQLGEAVPDLQDLWGFEIAQANGIDPQTLATAQDISVPVPGLPLAIDRSISSTITGHYISGPFGYGWTLGDGWGLTLAVGSDGTVSVTDSDGSERVFQPDSRNSAHYFAQTGDHGTLASLGNGVYTLTEPNGQVEDFQNGQIAFIEDANGNRITAGYTSGRLTSLTDTSGAFLDLTYNPAGLIASVTSSTGQTATYTYDTAGQHLLSVTDYEGFTTTYTYDSGGNPATANALASVTHPDGTEDEFSYDAEGRLSESSAGGGAQAVTYAYGIGGTVATTDADGGTTTRYIDDLGRVAKVVDQLQNSTLFAYDGSGNLVQTTDAAGQLTSYAYDPEGNVIQATNPLGEVTQYTYGPLDTFTSVTDAKGNVTKYQYNQNGDPTSTLYANGTIETAAYNPIGELLHATDPNGNTTTYTYNTAGQELSATYQDGTETTYTYDAHGNLISATDATGTVTLTYDSADQLTEVIYPDGTFLKYTYDPAGRRTQMVDQTGFTVKYVYDNLGVLSGLTDGSGHAIVTYTYDKAGRLSTQTMGDGTSTTYTYDLAGNLLSVVNHTVGGAVDSSFVYTYNNLGLCTTETTRQGQWVYTYDAIGELTHAVFTSNNPAQVANQDLQYAYDAAGNRTSTVVNGVTTPYVTNNMNQYTSIGATTFSYDADGSLLTATTGGATTTYTYDLQGDLVGVSAPGGATTYQYDALGNRVAVASGGQTTKYLVDPTGIGNVVAQFDGAGNLIAHFTYGLGLTSRVDSGGAAAYYTFDGKGNTVALTGSAGTDRYAYLPFGGILATSGSISNPFQYGGQQGVMSDSDGLVFMRARSYDPAQGRFLRPDPIGIAGGLNLYSYVVNNPIGFSDPTGALPVSAPWGFSPYDWQLLEDIRRLAKLLPANFVRNASQEFLSNPNWSTARGLLGVLRKAAFPGYNYPGSGGLLPVRTAGGGIYRFTTVAAEGGGGSAALATGSLLLGSLVGGLVVGTVINRALLTNQQKEIIGDTLEGIAESGERFLQFITGQKIVYPHDPNVATGPGGYGPQASIADTQQALAYTVQFQNAATATAPAHSVTVTDPIDPSLDGNTFQFTGVGFGDTVIAVPASDGQFFQTTVSTTENGQTFNVQIQLSFDPATSIATVTFQSLVPGTELPPDALTGFLPPEDGTGRGTGFFTYLVALRPGLPTGTQIRNVANVVFDGNPPIATDQVNDDDPSLGTDPAKQDLNTIDAGAPSSSVLALPAVSLPSFTVKWNGQDDNGGSGIATYDVYVSDNGGPFTLWQPQTPQTSATYTGVVGHTYGFYSVATDNVGNVQPTPTAAQATTQVEASVAQATTVSAVSGTGLYAGTATLSATLTSGATPLAGQTITFMLTTGGTSASVGTATTNAQGVATLGGVSLAGLGAGTASGAVRASFAGDSADAPSAAGGDLTVSPAPAVLSLGDLDFTFDGTAHTATVTTSPAGLSGVTVAYTQGDAPVTAPTAAGSYTVTATLANPNYTAPSVTGTLVITMPASTSNSTSTPPVKVTTIQWQNEKLGKKKTTKVLVVSFSGGLEPGPAQNLGFYHLASLGKARKSGTAASKPVALVSAVYNSSMNTVTLTPKGKVASGKLQLTITAAQVLDASGQPIQANQGGNVVATLGSSGGISVASAGRAGVPGGVSAEAVDTLLATGQLAPVRRPGQDRP